jgi:predicted GNAT family N-acyltransferase
MSYSKDCLTNMEIKPNSLILFFEKEDEVVGTIKLDYSIFGALEFDYNSYIKEENPIFLEVSKFLIKKEYRKTLLALNLMLMSHKVSEKYNPKYIVINSALSMKDYYLKLGFSLLSEEIIIHPKIKNESCLMISDYLNFKENILKK